MPSCRPSPGASHSSLRCCHLICDVAGTSVPKFTVALSEWQTRTGSVVVTPSYATIQKAWDAPLVSVLESEVLSVAPDQASKARLIAVAAPHSGAFLHARPCSSLGTRLDGSSLRAVVAPGLVLLHVCHTSVAQQWTAQATMDSTASSLPADCHDTPRSTTSSNGH
jgi:hypothetical protein